MPEHQAKVLMLKNRFKVQMAQQFVNGGFIFLKV